ncbi:hypothetical protein [Amniculibacterium aquaticum]|uniref:hypothetical protein n=1 Tax=Amniculibacterium aquaticum TaxID=2479858 RepID=UPI000F5B48D2|nr:hypothetical protein [Amniculibacterium aquaticum]
MMKHIYTIFLLLGFMQINAQYVFNSTHYKVNDEPYNTSNTIYFDFGNNSIHHTNGLNIKNYPLKLSDVKDQETPAIIILEADVTPNNYNSPIFQTYGFRGYQIYMTKDGIVGVVEIIKSYYSDKVRIIKYLK